MDIITDFEWFNNIGTIIRFDKNFGRPPEYRRDFSRDIKNNVKAIIGVRWNYNGQPIVFPDVWYAGSLPTPNMDKVIVTTIELLGKYHSKLFGELHQKKYTTAIYNADGSVHKVVEMPYPIMPNLGRGPTRDEKPETSEVYWCRKKVDDYSMLIRLGYHDAWEERYFNPETGEIGGLRSDKSYGYY